MPEGHTVHRIARDHHKWFVGQRMQVASPQGRFQAEATQLNGKKLRAVTAHGKHLFYHWPKELITHVHLGLYGKFRVHKGTPPQPRGAVRVRMIGDERAFDLNGPNCCELIDQSAYLDIRKRLGEDPLNDDACADTVWNRIRKSKAPIGGLLLNQSVIAGIGNIYRAEILFLCGIHPAAPGNQLDRASFDAMWSTTVELMRIGVKYNRIVTAGFNTPGRPLSRLNSAERINIYKREKCPKCSSRIRCWEIANRKIFACPKCQKP